MPIMEVLSERDIEERRTKLLEAVEMTEEELRERASTYTLSARESGILSEIDGLDFLLGE